MARADFTPGVRIHSVAVGRCAEFDGTVIGPYFKTDQVLVRADDGRSWVREPDREITVINGRPTREQKIEASFALIEAAAMAGERCPQTNPHGPIPGGAVTALVEAGRVRSEVYAHNWRRVVILVGPNKGKATAEPPGGGIPYLVNGVRADAQRRITRKIAP